MREMDFAGSSEESGHQLPRQTTLDGELSPQPTSNNVILSRNEAEFYDTPFPLSGRMPSLVDEIELTTKRGSKTTVEVQVVFLKIGEIDTVKEQYSADIHVQSRWREPLLDNKSLDELNSIDLSKFWNPCIYIENELTEKKISVYSTASQGKNGEAYITERRKVRGDFLENLELQNFPLDVQDLSITIVSERHDHDAELIPDGEGTSSVNVGTFADEQEWQLYQHVEITKKVKIEFTHQQQLHSAIQFTCRAARRPGYFYYNIFLVMFLISSLSFGTFTVEYDLPQNRLQLSFTLVLTAIAFKMAINQSLPKISYLTYADKYVLLSLIFLVFISVWHSIVPSFGKSVASKLEYWVLLGFGILYMTAHFVFLFFLYVNAVKRRLQMAQKDRQFQETGIIEFHVPDDDEID